MARYARFDEFRRNMSQIGLSEVCDGLILHKNKSELSKWINSQSHKTIASQPTPVQHVEFCSSEHSANSPFGYLFSEVERCAGVGISRLINRLVFEKALEPELFGEVFTYQYDNSHGAHSYDRQVIPFADNEILIAVNSNAPQDFIDSFNPHFCVQDAKQNSEFIGVLPKKCFTIGVAVLAKSQKIVQIHVGITLKHEANVRIITNEIERNHLDRMLV